VIVVGSQAILGTYDESQLPAAATMSIEVDILPKAETNEETSRLADLIEDLCVAKLIALREKDRNFVASLLEGNLVNVELIASRLATVSREHFAAVERALAWLNSTR
jgi:hypothetical protein